MKTSSRLFAVALCVSLFACSDPPSAPDVPAPTPQAATTERATPQQITSENQGALTDAQAAGLNAANQLSNALDDAERKRREELDAATK